MDNSKIEHTLNSPQGGDSKPEISSKGLLLPLHHHHLWRLGQGEGTAVRKRAKAGGFLGKLIGGVFGVRSAFRAWNQGVVLRRW